jgi:hypothetical protein
VILFKQSITKPYFLVIPSEARDLQFVDFWKYEFPLSALLGKTKL